MSLFFAEFLLYGMVFLFGIVVGSFLNVVIYRIPQNISVAKGRSFCPQCQKILKPYDMIPVLSWFFLRGKCRFCQKPIPFRYPLVELSGGVLGVISLMVLGFTPMGFLGVILAWILLALAFVDLDTMTIPPCFPLCIFLLGILAIFLNPDFTWFSGILGFFIISLPMLLLAMVIPGAFGGGDVKLMAVAGFLLGWKVVLVAFFIGLVAGGFYGILLLLRSKENRNIHFPFGPFLSFGIFTAFLWGNEIIHWYVSLL